jgi:pyridoxamine 5'-phosphate oxidase
MSDRSGIFAGDDPFEIARRWLAEATPLEPSDPNAMALSTVDADGMPNTRIVLLKAIEDSGFVFFTNYESAKGQEIAATGVASFVLHWKSLKRQVRARGRVEKVSADESDAYYVTRPLGSRVGAWASQQSRPLDSKAELVKAVAKAGVKHGANPDRPPFWGGFRIVPQQLEFWADGAFRLHDRFRWDLATSGSGWKIQRLNP